MGVSGTLAGLGVQRRTVKVASTVFLMKFPLQFYCFRLVVGKDVVEAEVFDRKESAKFPAFEIPGRLGVVL